MAFVEFCCVVLLYLNLKQVLSTLEMITGSSSLGAEGFVPIVLGRGMMLCDRFMSSRLTVVRQLWT